MTLLSICIPVLAPGPETAAPAHCNGDVAGLRAALTQMLETPDTGFEIVVGDFRGAASGTHAELAAGIRDPRLRLLQGAPDAATPSEAWNALIAEAEGAWVTIIDAGDYADPAICEVLRATIKRAPDAEALCWGRAAFVPPESREGHEIARVPTGSRLLLPEQTDLMRQLFYWAPAAGLTDCHVSAWHGAVRRDLLDRIAGAFSGVHAEQSQPWTDNLCKVVMLAKRMVMWERPLSVQRALPAFGPATGITEAVDGFPFSGREGNAARKALAIEAFKARYGIALQDWEGGFVQACARDCETAATGEQFHAQKQAYAGAIAAWRGKRALSGFKPEFRRKPKLPRFQGVKDGTLHFDMSMENCADAAAFYRLINAMSFPVSLLDEKLA